MSQGLVKRNEKIDIVFAADENYAWQMYVALVSVVQNTAEKCSFKIVDSGISDKTKSKISTMVSNIDNAEIEFIKIDTGKYFPNVKLNRGLPIAAYSRLLIPNVFSNLKRVIYMDCDIIALGDIAGLWNYDLSGHAIGACRRLGFREERLKNLLNGIHLPIDYKLYFNSGVLLIDCEKWRNDNYLADIIAAEKETRATRVLNDQDVLNKVFAYNYAQIPDKYNRTDTTDKFFEPFEHSINECVIKHYTQYKPWASNGASKKYADIWWKAAFKYGVGYRFFNNICDSSPGRRYDKFKLLYSIILFLNNYMNPLRKFRNKISCILLQKVPCIRIIWGRSLQWNFLRQVGYLPDEYYPNFNQKIKWAMMFDADPNRALCSDKIVAKRYVAGKIGGQYVVPLIKQYDNLSELNIAELPDGEFVIKSNSGSQRMQILKNKHEISYSLIRKWLMNPYHLQNAEMHYSLIKDKFFIEPLLDFGDGKLEYKIWCFGGKAMFVQVISYEKGHREIGTRWYSPEWQELNFYTVDYMVKEKIPRPARLNEMLELSEKLSEGFRFVRIDWYLLGDGTLKFGEMTFTPTAGRHPFYPKIADTILGCLYELPERNPDGTPVAV
jgi:lipopolysaccharide biosynthesis glycosyltransferase